VGSLTRAAVSFVLLLATWTTTGPAHAEGVVIASGRPGGYYHAIARGLRVVLRSEHGIATDVVPSSGSMENLATLDDPDSLVNVALAQADALQSYLVAHPDFADRYAQIADAGKECAFIVVPRKDRITRLDALAAEGRRTIAVGEAGSGAAVTWTNMTRMRPALAATRPVEQGVIEALLEMRGPRGAGQSAAAVMMVQRPMAVATPLEVVLQNKDDYALLPILPGDLGTSRHKDASGAYSFEKVVVGFGRESQAGIDTICTRGLVLASKSKLSTDELSAVRKAVETSRRYIMPDDR